MDAGLERVKVFVAEKTDAGQEFSRNHREKRVDEFVCSVSI